MTNPDVSVGGPTFPRGALHIARTKFLWQGACYERLCIKSYHSERIEASLLLQFEADFADIFEVRGTHRNQRGRRLAPSLAPGAVTLAYEGLDRVVRRTRITFSPSPTEITADQVRFDIDLPPRAESVFDVIVSCASNRLAVVPPLPFDDARTRSDEELRSVQIHACTLGGPTSVSTTGSSVPVPTCK